MAGKIPLQSGELNRLELFTAYSTLLSVMMMIFPASGNVIVFVIALNVPAPWDMSGHK